MFFLSADLIQNILCYIQGDVASLKACSLLSPAWTDPSQTILYRSLHLDISPKSFHEEWRPCRPRVRCEIQLRIVECYRFLLKHRRIARMVRGFHIHNRLLLTHSLLLGDLHRLLLLQPNLYKLRLVSINIDLHFPSSDLDFESSSPFEVPSIRTFEISAYEGSLWRCGYRPLVQWLHAFPNLTELRITNGALMNAPNWPLSQSLAVDSTKCGIPTLRIPSLVRNGLRLQTLHHDAPLSDPFLLEFVRRTVSRVSLTSVSIGLADYKWVVTAGWLIKELSGRLQNLCINLSSLKLTGGGLMYGLTPDAIVQSLRLDTCVRLQSLSIHLPLLDQPYSASTLLPVIIPPFKKWDLALLTIRSAFKRSHLSFRTLNFIFTPPCKPSNALIDCYSLRACWENAVPWSALREVLTCHCSFLEEVSLKATGNLVGAEWQLMADIIGKSLGDLQEFGIHLRLE